MKILVTGGAGFIGSNFINYIKNKYPHYELYNLDILKYPQSVLGTDKELIAGDHFIQADITDKDHVFQLFEKERFDIVVNFAAETNVDRSIETPAIFTLTNFLGAQNLMDACQRYGITRFHQISTDEVYGDLPLEGGTSFTEEATLRPSNPYAASKASADLLALSYKRTYGLPVSISRSSNNYGPRQYVDKLIPLIIDNAIKEIPLPIYGNGLNMRDWLYVADHCAAIDCILHSGSPGEIYNIASGNEKSNLDIVKMILSLLDKKSSLIKFVKDRKGHDLRYSLNTDKIRSELEWSPSVIFEEGIQKTIDWYLKYR